jgi:competence protein ComEC
MSKKKIISSIVLAIIVVLSIALGIVYNIDNNTNNAVSNGISNERNTPVVVNDNLFKVYYFNVGNSDCTLLQFNGYNMLIDGANELDAPYLVKYFKEQLKISSLDYVVATHSDEDHISGLDKIINSFDLGTFYMPQVNVNEEPNKDKELKEVIASVKNKNKEIETPAINHIFYLGSVKCEIKWIADAKILNDNKSSIVLQSTYGTTNFLFMGDYEQPTENDLKKLGINYKLPVFTQADVLKVAHHRV